ncbi:MAG: ParB/RepB/Spo0J family partition protein [Armatimonadota bacterium]
MSKKVLGKGLSALIPERIEEKGREEKIAYIPIEKIAANSSQPRKTFAPEKLKELVDSIRENGIIQPVVVVQKLDKYELVVGERRYRAAKELGLKDLPCIVKKGMSRCQTMETALIENIQREDLNPIEEAMAYHYLIKEHSLTHEYIAKKVGKSRPVITNALRLLALPPDMRNDIASSIVSEGHARLVLSVDDEKVKQIIWNKIKEKFLSVRQTENLIENMIKETDGKKRLPKKESADVLHIENELTEALATKVKIKLKSKNKGKIEINFNNSEELERLLELLTYLQEKGSSRQILNESLL